MALKNETFVQICKYKSLALFQPGNFFLSHLFHRFNEHLTAIKSINFRCSILWGARFIIFVSFCCGQKGWAQQEPQFSQNMFNMLTVNPGWAGMSNMVNLQAISRQQYVGGEGMPKTTVFGADMAISPMGYDAGIGIQFISDQIGFIEDVGANLNASIKLPITKGVLGVGLVMGFKNHSVDPEWYYATEIRKTDYHDDSDPHAQTSKVSGSVFDFGLGVFYQGDGCYAGISVLHLFEPEPKFDLDYYYYLKRSFFFTAGKKYALIDKPIEFYPSVFMKTDGVSLQSDWNCNIYYKKRYWGGLSYRTQDAVVLLAGLEMKSGLRIGYSYDIPVSTVAKSYGGGHEISVGYTFEMSIDKKVKKHKSVRYL
ncbi:MAG: type IX secretion system membrane protein PorP/SprF [Breznakibacter sp.]